MEALRNSQMAVYFSALQNESQLPLERQKRGLAIEPNKTPIALSETHMIEALTKT